MDTSDIAVSLLIGTLFVYGVGIAVPALVRFVFYKKPFSKGAAIGLLVVWWLILFTSIYFLKGENKPNNLPLFIVMVISFGILTKGANKEDPTKSAEQDEKKITN